MTLFANGTEIGMERLTDTSSITDTGQHLVASLMVDNITNTTSDVVFRRSDVELIGVGIILALVIGTTIFGNLLVTVTVITNKNIQTPTNYFILSLAVTDLCIGILVMPFSAVNTLHWEWPLGAIFCNIYTSFDVMLCTVSILTLFAISLDRYFAVTIPLRYPQKVSCRIVRRLCAAVWLFSFVLAFVPIMLGWNTVDGKVQNMDNPRACEFGLNRIYVMLISIGTYFAPLIVMSALYMKVLLITKRQVQRLSKMCQMGHFGNSDGVLLRRGSTERQHRQKLASDTKATITLASLVLAFAICWVPYFALFTVKPFVQTPINIHADLFCLWLGYLNSAINPFLYAYYSSAFRNAFARVLCRGLLAKYVYNAKLKQRRHKANMTRDTAEMSALNGRRNRPAPV